MYASGEVLTGFTRAPSFVHLLKANSNVIGYLAGVKNKCSFHKVQTHTFGIHQCFLTDCVGGGGLSSIWTCVPSSSLSYEGKPVSCSLCLIRCRSRSQAFCTCKCDTYTKKGVTRSYSTALYCNLIKSRTDPLNHSLEPRASKHHIRT